MLRKLLVTGAVFGLALLFGVDQAQAGWGSHGWSYGSHGGSHGSWGSYSSYGSHGSQGSHGSHGSYGSLGCHGKVRHYGHGGFASRWYFRHHATRYHRFGCWGSHGGSWGSYGSHGLHGSFGSTGSHGTVVSSCGSSGGSVIYSDPVQKGGVIQEGGEMLEQQKPAVDAEVTPMSTQVDRADATLTIHVPADSKLFVNGLQTKATGEERKFVSRGLEKGFQYTYEVRVEAERNGELVSDIRTVKMTAGQNLDVTLNPQPLEQVASTTVEVHVPADAKVYLAGTLTKSTGPVRVFKTSKLKTGESWDDYRVRIELNEGGRVVTKEKTIRLVGGDSKVVRFNADEPHVAAVTR